MTAATATQSSLLNRMAATPLLAAMAAGFVLVATLGATWLMWHTSVQSHQQNYQQRFDALVNDDYLAIAKRMKQYEVVLRSVVALSNIHGIPSRGEWKRLVDDLKVQENFPGILAVAYSQRVAAQDLAAHIETIRAQGYPEYKVHPAHERAEYNAIIYLEPFSDRNRRAFGYDMFTEPTRRAAMERARDSGDAALSGKITLVQETHEKRQAGNLMYLPVYRGGSMPPGVATRREALIGYVYAPFRMDDLLFALRGATSALRLRIYDGVKMENASLLYDDINSVHNSAPQQAVANPAFHHVREIVIAGHTWTLQFESNSAFEARMDWSKPRLIAGFGTLLSLLLAAMALRTGSARQRAERMVVEKTRELEATTNRLRTIIETAVDGIIVFDTKGVVESFNPAAALIFGYEADDVIGRNITMLVRSPEKEAASLFMADRKSVNGPGAYLEREITGLRKDGGEFAMEIAIGEFASDGQRRYMGIFRDITMRKQAELTLRRANEGLEEFAQVASHDLRAPLRGISELLSWIKSDLDEAGNATALKNLERVELRVSRMEQLITDLLTYYRAGSASTEPVEFAPRDIVDRIHELQPLPAGFELKNDIPTMTLKASVTPLETVLRNLIGNAVKHHDRDKGTISINAARKYGFTEFNVTDDGPGIPARAQERIFKLFQTATSPDRKGSGVGLSVCKRLVESHGGQIMVVSDDGARGATFRFTWPDSERDIFHGESRSVTAVN